MKYTVLNYWKQFLLICLIFAVLFSTAAGGPWDLDVYFGDEGITTFPTGQSNSTVRAVEIQPDERIVMAGYSANGDLRSNRYPTLERMLPNGLPDPSFGTGGLIVFPFAGEFESLVIQPDGKFLMAGTVFSRGDTGSRYLVVRCNADGSLDTTFNGTGMILGVWERRSRFSYADKVLLRPDGRIIVAGSSKALMETFAVAQYNPNGSLDNAFGVFGTSILPGTRHVESAVLQPDGKVVLAGLSNFTLARILTDGSLDPTFGNGGVTFRIFTDYCEVKSIKLQPDGKIVAAGWGYYSLYNYNNYVIARYNPNGSLDTSFGTGGRVLTGPQSFEHGYDVEIQPNGKIVVAGVDTIWLYPRFRILRLNPDGTGDESFHGGQKILITPFIPIEESVLKIQRDGKIIVAGGTNSASHVAVRLGNSFDRFDFDGDGKDDASCFRPSNSNWNILSTEFDTVSSTHWGLPTDSIVPADYDGDGKTNIAVFRDGAWKILWYDNTYHNIILGQTGDIPRPGDFDGDGKVETAVWRPSNGDWYWKNTSDGQLIGVHFGIGTDLPLIADFDGDKKSDVALYRSSNSTWLYLKSTTGQYIVEPFGAPGDIPVPADYDGDSKTNFVVFRPSNGYWYGRWGTGYSFSHQLGVNGDILVPADYDGDHWTDLAVFRPSTNTWHIRYSNINYLDPYPGEIQFCEAGDRPIPSVFLP